MAFASAVILVPKDREVTFWGLMATVVGAVLAVIPMSAVEMRAWRRYAPAAVRSVPTASGPFSMGLVGGAFAYVYLVFEGAYFLAW